MLIPIAVQHPPKTWVFRAPGARCTVVYEMPVPIRALAEDLGVTMSFLHRKVRSGHLPGVRVGDQVLVAPDVADRVREWHKDHKGEKWPVFTATVTGEGDADVL